MAMVQQEIYYVYCLREHKVIASAGVAPADAMTDLDRERLKTLQGFADRHMQETSRDTADGGLMAHSTRVITEAVKTAWEKEDLSRPEQK